VAAGRDEGLDQLEVDGARAGHALLVRLRIRVRVS